MSKLCIDLCSGLGGFSQAFVDAGWDVVRVDIERKFKPTIQADVRFLPFRDDLRVDVGLASPPCGPMSVAAIRHHWTKDGKPKETAQKAIMMLHHIRDWLTAHTEAHLIEQPMGMACRPEVMGRPNMRINQSDYGTAWKKRTDLWGNIVLPLIEGRRDWAKAPRGSKAPGSVQWATGSEIRSKLPLKLSQAVLKTVSE